jgi:hypothetical protein
LRLAYSPYAWQCIWPGDLTGGGEQVTVVSIERKVFSRVMGPLRDLLRRNMTLYNSYISLNL